MKYKSVDSVKLWREPKDEKIMVHTEYCAIDWFLLNNYKLIARSL